MDTILVVDDEANYLTVMEALLGEAGYEVLTAPGGQEALKIAGTTDLDLVLTDMKMPRMNGIELLGELKRLYPDLPVIMMTAFGTVEKAVAAMKIGAYDYILKPFKNEELLVTIAKALEHRRLVLQNRLLQQDLGNKYGFPNIVGESKVMREILARYDVHHITPRELSQLIEELHAAGTIGPAELQDLARIRWQLDREKASQRIRKRRMRCAEDGTRRCWPGIR